MDLIESMSGTAQGLRSAASRGGHFYFVSDRKGQQAVLIAIGKDKDAEGAKTARLGRSVLRAFKKAHGACVFAQGAIEPDPLRFVLGAGSARPSLLVRAFKKSPLLEEGLGAAARKLRSAKVTAGGQGAEPEAASGEAAAAWAASPRGKALVAELGLDEGDIRELAAADAAFQERADLLGSSAAEDEALQLQQAETEALLDTLRDGEDRLRALLAAGSHAEAGALERALNQQRVEMAIKNPSGPDPFDDTHLSAVDRQALLLALNTGMQLLLVRIRALHATTRELRLALEAPDIPPEHARDLYTQREDVLSELLSLQTQLAQTRTD